MEADGGSSGCGKLDCHITTNTSTCSTNVKEVNLHFSPTTSMPLALYKDLYACHLGGGEGGGGQYH